MKFMYASLIAVAGSTAFASGAFAQSPPAAPPSFQGDPSVYKVIFENEYFRVIEANRGKGVHDKAHGHPVPSIVYNVTECKTKQYGADGKTTEGTSKAGQVTAVPVIPSHSAENTGPSDCKQIFVERK